MAQRCNSAFRIQIFPPCCSPILDLSVSVLMLATSWSHLDCWAPKTHVYMSSGKSQVCPLVSGGKRQNLLGSHAQQTSALVLLASTGSFPLSIFPSFLSPEPRLFSERQCAIKNIYMSPYLVKTNKQKQDDRQGTHILI